MFFLYNQTFINLVSFFVLFIYFLLVASPSFCFLMKKQSLSETLVFCLIDLSIACFFVKKQRKNRLYLQNCFWQIFINFGLIANSPPLEQLALSIMTCKDSILSKCLLLKYGRLDVENIVLKTNGASWRWKSIQRLAHLISDIRLDCQI